MLEALPRKASIEFNMVNSERAIGDCRTQVFKQLLNHYGCFYEAEEIFGLGEGLGFSLREGAIDGIPLLGIEGRCFEAEMTCCKKIGIQCKEHRLIYDKTKLFDEKILSQIVHEKPVIIQCDVFYLDYLDLDKNYHNEEHLFILVGYDLDKEQLYVVDSLKDEVASVDMKCVYKAMFESRFDSDNTGLWYEINPLKEIKKSLTSESYLDSLSQLSQRWLSTSGDASKFVDFIGFVERLISKAEKGSTQHEKYLDYLVSSNSVLVRRQDEISGTCFRSMFKAYLQRIQKKFGSSSEGLNEVIEMMTHVEVEWRAIAFKLRYNKSDVLHRSQMFLTHLKNIQQLEQALFLNIKNRVLESWEEKNE